MSTMVWTKHKPSQFSLITTAPSMLALMLFLHVQVISLKTLWTKIVSAKHFISGTLLHCQQLLMTTQWLPLQSIMFDLWVYNTLRHRLSHSRTVLFIIHMNSYQQLLKTIEEVKSTGKKVTVTVLPSQVNRKRKALLWESYSPANVSYSEPLKSHDSRSNRHPELARW